MARRGRKRSAGSGRARNLGERLRNGKSEGEVKRDALGLAAGGQVHSPLVRMRRSGAITDRMLQAGMAFAEDWEAMRRIEGWRSCLTNPAFALGQQVDSSLRFTMPEGKSDLSSRRVMAVLRRLGPVAGPVICGVVGQNLTIEYISRDPGALSALLPEGCGGLPGKPGAKEIRGVLISGFGVLTEYYGRRKKTLTPRDLRN